MSFRFVPTTVSLAVRRFFFKLLYAVVEIRTRLLYQIVDTRDAQPTGLTVRVHSNRF